MCLDHSWRISASIAAWPPSTTRSAKKAPFWHATFYLTALGDDCAYQRPSFKADALYYGCTTSTCNLLLFFTGITFSRYARIRPLCLTTQCCSYATNHFHNMSLVDCLLCTIVKRIPYRQAPTLHRSFTGPYYLTSVFAIVSLQQRRKFPPTDDFAMIQSLYIIKAYVWGSRGKPPRGFQGQSPCP